MIKGLGSARKERDSYFPLAIPVKVTSLQGGELGSRGEGESLETGATMIVRFRGLTINLSKPFL